MKGDKHQNIKDKKQRCCSLCWKFPDGAQSFVFSSQIVTERTEATFLFVSKMKKIGMLLNVVNRQVHKIIQQGSRLHNHSTLLTMVESI